jgi:cytochrome c oxidase subunit 1
MLFALGTIATFLMGGVTGIFNGSAAYDIYIHDTYFVVAHFHYTLFPVTFLAGFAALYFWFPKMFGRMLDERLGELHFWATFVFFNVTFLPQFLLGMGGHMRRIYDPTSYEFLKPLLPVHRFVTAGAILLLIGQIPFVVNVLWSLVAGRAAEPNPWRANTLEWATPSPPPHGNFPRPPVVHRGPYEYSHPGVADDWLPQDEPALAAAS